jgi:hypothetical protein
MYDHINSAVDCPVASSFDVFYGKLFCVNQLYDLDCSEHILARETFLMKSVVNEEHNRNDGYDTFVYLNGFNHFS